MTTTKLTKVAKATKESSGGHAPIGRPALWRFVSFVIFVIFVVSDSRVLNTVASAQGDATEAELRTASLGCTVRIGSIETGRVTTMPLEVYVSRVLAGEGEPRAPGAAQQALAVAIRTFAIANAGRHGRDGYDLCDGTHCQVLRVATAVTRRAALSTAGQVLTFEGAAAEVFYSASCGGQSESASDVWPGANYPYLRSVPDDVHEDDVPWTLDLTLPQIERALRRAGFAGDRLTSVEVDARSASGRVARLRVIGLEPDVVAGDQFRAAVGAGVLRSTSFSIAKNAGTLQFTGLGYGHGVGMCVVGAGRRAMRGETFQAILAQYYPGLELARIETVMARAPAGPGSAVSSAAAPVAVLPAAVPPAGARTAPAPAAATARSGTTSVVARVSRGSSVAAADVERMAARAHDDLSKVLGTSLAPVTIEVHGTLDSFRMATGRPWWVSAVAGGTSIDLAPAAVLEQRDGIEKAIRIAMGELLMGTTLADRPAWVRIGAARYFARPGRSAPEPSIRVRCPSDAELTLAISASAQREAESRAETCFARAYDRTHDWRTVR